MLLLVTCHKMFLCLFVSVQNFAVHKFDDLCDPDSAVPETSGVLAKTCVIIFPISLDEQVKLLDILVRLNLRFSQGIPHLGLWRQQRNM